MRAVRVWRAGGVPLSMLDDLSSNLAALLRVTCRVESPRLETDYAFDLARGQYHSTAILQRLVRQPSRGESLLAVTSGDLFVPVLTYVFGESQVGGAAAVVSIHRLREEFYGLPSNAGLLRQRLLKEAMHELGHVWGLRHCDDWRCVMATTHSAELIDVKEAGFCRECAWVLDGSEGAPLHRHG